MVSTLMARENIDVPGLGAEFSFRKFLDGISPGLLHFGYVHYNQVNRCIMHFCVLQEVG